MDKKALDSIGKHPKPGQPECHLMIVVSTAHLHSGNPEKDSVHGVFVDEYEHGWYLVLADDEDPSAPWQDEGMKNIATYARMLGATTVRVDQDGPVVEALQQFNWDDDLDLREAIEDALKDRPAASEYTVILQYPDYIPAEAGSGNTWMGHAYGKDKSEAILNARTEVMQGLDENVDPEDLYTIAVIAGHHNDLNA